MKTFTEFISKINEVRSAPLTLADEQLLERGYNFGELAHSGQLRASGESYFSAHSVQVALKIASLGYDTDTIAAGLLHDTIEDTDTTWDELNNEFGKSVADLVEGVSKLGSLKYQGNERHVESLRKFFLAVAKDVRVVVIKLCDRWHNLETLEHLPKEKQQRIAKESIAIHAQLASRLGIGSLVTTINDLAFPYAYPEEYKKTKAIRENRLTSEDEVITKIYRTILAELTESLGYQPKVDKRLKGLFSLYKKLERKDWNIDEVYDLIALRVIVRDTADCYASLGIVHGHWRPVPGRVKDYIALPKPNGYQSLHTAIFSGSGPIVEVQIRSEEMHAYNEYGIASHHLYKLNQYEKVAPQSAAWLEQLGEFQNQEISSNEYMNELELDFFKDRLFALTPKGDVIDLPHGATVLDFAYSIHSDIGDNSVGGKIDGKFVALKTELESGQIIEIITDKKARPSSKWLEWVVTNHARDKIKRHLSRTRKELVERI